MAEPRKNHLDIDGAQVKEDDHTGSYKPITDSDQDNRISKSILGKSKEKVSDPAEEKLLDKDAEAKIVTRVDMGEAKYVVGDQRNGDPTVQLDAKRQFTGLTKEELARFADDPFWVRLRWAFFILFWALWLAMLAGAIAIIVNAPKCPLPKEKTWYESGPLVDSFDLGPDPQALVATLDNLKGDPSNPTHVKGIFINPCAETYDVLEETNTCVQDLKSFFEKAKESSIKVIVDLTANTVSTTHKWFTESQNKAAEFLDYFTWKAGKDHQVPPNNWISKSNTPAWTWSEPRQEFYLSQISAGHADLNFTSAAVRGHFDRVIQTWLTAGASGIRLRNARLLLSDPLLTDEAARRQPSAVVHTDYSYWQHERSADQGALVGLLEHFAGLLKDDHVFTLFEDGTPTPKEWFRTHPAPALRPPSARALVADWSSLAHFNHTNNGSWPAVQLTPPVSPATPELQSAVVAVSMLLAAAPVTTAEPFSKYNDTAYSELASLASLRSEKSVLYGESAAAAVVANTTTGANTTLLFVGRWKIKTLSYAAVLNSGAEPARGSLTGVRLRFASSDQPAVALPNTLKVYHATTDTKDQLGIKTDSEVLSSNVTVPAYSTIVFSYVPIEAAEI